MGTRPGRRRATLIACVVAVAAPLHPLAAPSEGPGHAAYIDVHMHLDGVAREGPRGEAPERGPRRKGGSPRSGPSDSAARDYRPAADALVRAMDEQGVARAIVMPPPQHAGKAGSYDYDDLLPAIEAHPDRLALGAGGGTLNPMINGTDPAGVKSGDRRAFEEEAERIVKAGARAFGEMTAMHLCMNPLHHYIASPPDHPLFLLLADIAARHDVPIDLHMEAVAKDLPTPESLAAACDQNPDVIPATLPAFERLLAHNRRAKIVWQHIGWDNTGQMTPPLLRRLLNDHPNLHVAIKAVPGEKTAARPNRIHDDEWRILPEWLALFRELPDRFVVGADEFINVGGGAYKKPPFFEQTWRAMRSLPPELARKIGRENAARLYGL